MIYAPRSLVIQNSDFHVAFVWISLRVQDRETNEVASCGQFGVLDVETCALKVFFDPISQVNVKKPNQGCLKAAHVWRQAAVAGLKCHQDVNRRVQLAKGSRIVDNNLWA